MPEELSMDFRASASAKHSAVSCIASDRRRKQLTVLALALLFLLCFFLSFLVGRYGVTPKTVLAIFVSRVLDLEQTWEQNAEIAVLQIRMPRILTAALVGGSLSVAGLSFQALFKNSMAAPDILGASSGASFGAALALYFHLDAAQVSASAFIWGLAAVCIAYLASLQIKSNPILGLILSGVMISSLFNAAVSYLKLVADAEETLPAITYWLMGSFSGASYSELGTVVPSMAVGLAGLLYLRWKLSVLSLGDEDARALGLPTRAYRIAVILFATLLTTASVSVSGIIGWVGLVIPHFSRMLVGEDQRVLMPAALFMGAGFMLLVDDLARSLSTMDTPVGILTAFVGAPFFLYLMIKRGGNL